MLDSPRVQEGFDQIWQASNADAPLSTDRRERGGWVVRNGDGSLGFQEFTDVVSRACSMEPADGYAPKPPPNAVAWVHTHPFSVGELPSSCMQRDPATGLYTIPTYVGRQSRDDAVIGDRINGRLSAMGKQQIHGIVLDKDGIRRFRPTGFQDGSALNFPSVNRCGY